MKYFILALLLLSLVTAKRKKRVQKKSCDWEERRGLYLKGYDRASKAKVFPSIEKAKAACEKDEGCGAVGQDLIPYRKKPGAPTLYTSTIYLLPGVNMPNMFESAVGSSRYNSFVKGECKSTGNDKRKKNSKNDA